MGDHVDLDGFRAAHRGLAHAARDDRCVGGLATPRGQDAGRSDHAGQVVGVGLPAHEDHIAALSSGDHRVLGVEDDLADGCAGGGSGALGGRLLAVAAVELREHQLGQLRSGHAAHGLVHVDEIFFDQLGRDAESSASGAFADAGLQHPQLPAFDGELDVAQVAVVLLEGVHDVHEFGVRTRLEPLEVRQGQRVADAGDDILTLGRLKVVAVHAAGAGGRVAGERHAGAGVLAGVAEDHRLHVDRGAQVAGDALLAAVQLGARGVPGTEHRLDRTEQLFAGVLREVCTVRGHDLLVAQDQSLERLRGNLDVGLDAGLDHHLVQGVGEQVAVEVQDGLSEHLDQPPVGVPRETFVARLLGQAVHGLVVEPDVQDRLHHPGHRELRPGPHRQQQGIGGVAQRAAHLVFEGVQARPDLVEQLTRR